MDQQEIGEALRQVEEDNRENSKDEWEVLKEIAQKFPDLGNGNIILLDENYVPFGKKNYMDSNYQALNQRKERLIFWALLSKSLSSDEKLRIIETEYDIPIEESIRKENRYGRYKNRKRESKRDYGQAGGKHWRLSKEPDIFSKQYKVLFLV